MARILFYKAFTGPLCSGLLLFFMVGCASKKDDQQGHMHGEHEVADWKEMDDFHMLMAETFHPYKDSANLEPARRMASEMMTAAAGWVAAPLPEKVNTEEMKSRLQQLKTEATALAESVQMGDDIVIGDRLTTLHDTFHEIQDAWYRGDH